MNTKKYFNNGYKSARQTVLDYGYDFTFNYLREKLNYIREHGGFSYGFTEAYWDGYAQGLNSLNNGLNKQEEQTMDKKCTICGKLNPTCHRDGTVTYWSVYRQSWVRHAEAVPDNELAAMSATTRERIIAHIQ